MYKLIWIIFLGLFFSSCSNYTKNFKKRETKRIVKTTKREIGVPYKWGGEDRSGFDCSGLLFYSYNRFNFNIPRVTSQQQNFGDSIPSKKAKIGDWVMFATGGSSSINHIGLIIKVLGKEDFDFIHSSTSKGVRIDNINNSYWKKAYVKVVRPSRIKKK